MSDDDSDTISATAVHLCCDPLVAPAVVAVQVVAIAAKKDSAVSGRNNNCNSNKRESGLS